MKSLNTASLLLLVLPGAALAATTTFTPVADTYTRSGVGAGTAENLDVRGFGGGDFEAYIRFDLSSLSLDLVNDATLTLHETTGSRNDGITTGRFMNFGLTLAAGNTPQNWDEGSDLTPGAEYSNVSGNLIDTAQVYNLDADTGANVTESVPGTDAVACTLTGPDLVAFLNQRISDDGSVTFINVINANNRGYGFASKENADNTLWPTLEVTYAPVPEPSSLALVGLGLAGLLAYRRRARR